ncbi:MAG: glutamyl-tRNA reductase [Saprospiraceae bacterium]|nr:glutamyl-tRNA reductase [Saprospiraceae bacterium]
MTSVKLIAISHETAGFAQRAVFHLNEKEKQEFIKGVTENFDINGILVLATCNRTEIYFETRQTSTQEVLEYLLAFKNVLRNTYNAPRNTYYENYFTLIDNTKGTIKHLLEVVSGLRSLVVGDMQIISQFKEAFVNSQNIGMQGQVLERMVQSVFKMHKRIQNETDFRKGSASTSYLALTAARQHFGKKNLATKNVLLIGAGEIIKDVAKYSEKFAFNSITLINRTKAKAEAIANDYNFQIENWENLNEAVAKADIVISGVSNQTNLVTKTIALESSKTEKLFIDLGMPANIDVNLATNPNFKLINIDQLNTKSEQVEANRQNAIDAVHAIIDTELASFQKWLNRLPANESLGKLKNHIHDY